MLWVANVSFAADQLCTLALKDYDCEYPDYSDLSDSHLIALS